MEAVGTRTVHLIHAALLTRLQVEQPEVGFRMPNGEIAPVGNGVHEIASVGRRSRPGDGWLVGCVDECVDIAREATRALVESYAAENVLFFVCRGITAFVERSLVFAILTFPSIQHIAIYLSSSLSSMYLFDE